jgi:hypothetical protein
MGSGAKGTVQTLSGNTTPTVQSVAGLIDNDHCDNNKMYMKMENTRF